MGNKSVPMGVFVGVHHADQVSRNVSVVDTVMGLDGRDNIVGRVDRYVSSVRGANSGCVGSSEARTEWEPSIPQDPVTVLGSRRTNRSTRVTRVVHTRYESVFQGDWCPQRSTFRCGIPRTLLPFPRTSYVYPSSNDWSTHTTVLIGPNRPTRVTVSVPRNLHLRLSSLPVTVLYEKLLPSPVSGFLVSTGDFRPFSFVSGDPRRTSLRYLWK